MNKKNIVPAAACAAVVAGLIAMWALVLSGNKSGGEEGSGLVIIDESGTSTPQTTNDTVMPEHGTILENVDIYKYHDYPTLSDGDFITLAELAENKDKYIESIVGGSYDNFRFAVTPDFDVPEEIGRYQIATLTDYRENAEEALKYMIGDSYDESYFNDMFADRNYGYYPLGVYYGEFGEGYEETMATVSYEGIINYASDWATARKFDSTYGKNITGEYYVAGGKYEDDKYTVGGKAISISQFVDNAQKYLDGLNEIIPLATQYKPIAVFVAPDSEGNNLLRAELAPMYKSVPLLCFYPGDNRAEDEYNLMNGIEWHGDIITSDMSSTDGEAIENFYISNQYRDYKTLEEYDKIIAPDKAAKLLSEYLAPDLNAEIIGMGLSYYNMWVGSQDTEELPIEGHTCFTGYQECTGEHYKKESVYELTPFWTFYFDLNPSVIGLVNCKTGEATYLHNYPPLG